MITKMYHDGSFCTDPAGNNSYSQTITPAAGRHSLTTCGGNHSLHVNGANTYPTEAKQLIADFLLNEDHWNFTD
ncbi:MAG: hypothetical protein ACPGCS_02125 [Opitutales bacterium]